MPPHAKLLEMLEAAGENLVQHPLVFAIEYVPPAVLPSPAAILHAGRSMVHPEADGWLRSRDVRPPGAGRLY